MSPLTSRIAAVLDQIPSDFGGACSVSKANLIAWLIRRYGLHTTLDIGVYRGRSLFPQALAHQQYAGGIVYGVDPWSSVEAKENDNLALKDAIHAFVDQLDFERIYQDVMLQVERLDLKEHCIMLRQTSASAIEYFDKNGIFFDLIHVDGNHDTEKVMRDIIMYLPRLNKEGFLIMDDISWESVHNAYQTVSANLPLLFKRIDRANDYAVFWKNRSFLRPLMRRFFIQYMGRQWT
jgi:predicted O-methyltransferase YrrM